MTRIVAIETATDACSVALWQDGAVLEKFEPGARRQTERVLPMVEELLAEAGIELSSVDALAFGQGPGSFTGVRVATSVVQGLAFSLDLPVVGVSTLASCALAAHDLQPRFQQVVAVFDARMGEVYFGAYRCGGDKVEALCDEGVFTPERIPVLDGGDWLLAGSGTVYQDALRDRLTWAGVDAEAMPRAATVARLAVAAVREGRTVPAEQAQPVYLRDRVVQIGSK